jgi:hypothetical protein
MKVWPHERQNVMQGEYAQCAEEGANPGVSVGRRLFWRSVGSLLVEGGVGGVQKSLPISAIPASIKSVVSAVPLLCTENG